jgi:ElaB/YqjD/DUF883 family membrane-anchored ribosome-binding protein
MSRTYTRIPAKTSKQNCAASRNGAAHNGAIHRDTENDFLRTVQKMGAEIKKSMKLRAADMKEAAGDYLAQGQKKARSLEKSIEKKISKRPLASLALAAGCGIVLGWCCRRGRKKSN